MHEVEVEVGELLAGLTAAERSDLIKLLDKLDRSLVEHGGLHGRATS